MNLGLLFWGLVVGDFLLFAGGEKGGAEEGQACEAEGGGHGRVARAN